MHPPSGSPAAAERLALEFLQRVWHPPHELDAIDQLMTEDYVIVSGGKVIRGRAAFKEWVRQFQRVLLDAHTESVDVFADSSGERVAIWRVRDGRLAKCWAERSAWELYQELRAGQ